MIYINQEKLRHNERIKRIENALQMIGVGLCMVAIVGIIFYSAMQGI